jgi:hypothetical protein
MHLQAAAALIPTIKAGDMVLSEIRLSPAYKVAMYFFAGVIVWYDILSCATTGSKPFSECSCLDAGLGYIHLDKLMGCENWAMLLIMDIAVLDEWKKSSQVSGKLSMRQLVSRGAQIEKRLEDGLEKNSGTIGGFTEHSMTSNANSLGYDSEYIRCVLTRIFACSALVYLHVAISGAHPELPDMRASVSRTIAAFQMLPNQELVRSLTWPFCIAGCMALPEQEDFFRDIVSTTNKVTPLFGNSGKALAIIEECWRMRKSQSHQIGTSSWETAMRSLGFNILLV